MAKIKQKAISIQQEFDEKQGWHEKEVELYVGMPCTYSIGTDRLPAFVSRISDSGKNVWIKDADYKPDKENGFDYFSNQIYIITPNNNMAEQRVTKRKDGRWKIGGYSNVAFGYARKYQDPHF